MRIFYLIFDFLEGLFQGKSVSRSYNDSKFYNEKDNDNR
jgi:hypothetical protein